MQDTYAGVKSFDSPPVSDATAPLAASSPPTAAAAPGKKSHVVMMAAIAGIAGVAAGVVAVAGFIYVRRRWDYSSGEYI